MPTRNQIRNATPRCPGTKTGTTNHQECGRLVLAPEHAHQLDEAAA